MAHSMENYSYNKELDELIDRWMQWDRNPKTRDEILQLVKDLNWTKLGKLLLDRLEFGTAGLRARMGAGFAAMNDLVIIQTAQGLCDYIVKQFPDKEIRRKRGIVLGYDGRYNSKRFAELTACIFLQREIKVGLYGKMIATPFVPFAILQKQYLAGVMVTASHNPKEDNGYKVYWANGAQIIPPHDSGIQQCILKHLEPEESSWNTDILGGHELLEDPYDEMTTDYLKKLKEFIPDEFVSINRDSSLRFVYTAMHGVGYPFVQKAFEVAQLQPVLAVDEQRDPDPEFPTVEFPNPEEGKSSLELSIAKANAEIVSIILANDPDADRLACAEKNPESGDWKIFKGNELGALLGWWAIENHKVLHPCADLSKTYMLASTVSSKILKSMAAIDGFQFDETLTGFKWMGNRSIELQKQGHQVLFAFEEAIGFMFSTTVLDKDGVSAACHLATMACYLKSKHNRSLAEQLHEIYTRYGYHYTNCSYYHCYDSDVIERIFERLRNFQNGLPKTYPSSILDTMYPIKWVRDLTVDVDTAQSDGKARLPVSKSSQMITFTFENDTVVTLRTSGTEKKIKYYAEICAQPGESDWLSLRNLLDQTIVPAIIEEFLEPERNQLKPKKD